MIIFNVIQETSNGPVYQEAYPNKADALEALADSQKLDPASSYKLVETEMTDEEYAQACE
jgi:hypothetical protein